MRQAYDCWQDQPGLRGLQAGDEALLQSRGTNTLLTPLRKINEQTLAIQSPRRQRPRSLNLFQKGQRARRAIKLQCETHRPLAHTRANATQTLICETIDLGKHSGQGPARQLLSPSTHPSASVENTTTLYKPWPRTTSHSHQSLAHAVGQALPDRRDAPAMAR